MHLQDVLHPLLAFLLASLLGCCHCADIIKSQPLYEIVQADIIAPITTEKFGEYYKGKIGPAAWVCTDLNQTSPDIAYDNIRSYFNKGNLESKQMELNTWPVIETKGAKSELCVYLEKKYHCYPPNPSDPKIIRGINEHLYRHYYGRVFWGQASDNRVKYEEVELQKALQSAGITESKVTYGVRYLAYFPNHVREVRFDAKDPEITELPESSFTTEFVTADVPPKGAASSLADAPPKGAASSALKKLS